MIARSTLLGKVLWLEPLWLLFLGPVVLLPGLLGSPGLHAAFVLLLCLFWPLRWLAWVRAHPDRAGRAGPRLLYPLQSPASLSLLLIVAWLPINLWAAVDRVAAWNALGYLAYGIALYVALINWQPSRQRPTIIALALATMGIGLVIVAPFLVQLKLQFRLFYLPLYDQLTQLQLARTETIHANVLAGALILIAPLFVAVAIAPRRNDGAAAAISMWLRILTAAGSIVILSVVILTQSRGAYLAAAAALAILALLRWPRLLWIGVPLGMVALFLLSRADLRDVFDLLSRDGTLGGWEGRLDIWRNSVQALGDFSFTGIGIGTFTTILPLLYPLQFSVESYPHAHNHFLQIGLDLGVPGLIAYVACILNVFVMAGALYRRRHALSPMAAALSIGSIGSLVAIFIHGILDAVLWGTKLAFLPWILFALITTLFLATNTKITDSSRTTHG